MIIHSVYGSSGEVSLELFATGKVKNNVCVHYFIIFKTIFFINHYANEIYSNRQYSNFLFTNYNHRKMNNEISNNEQENI